MTRAGETEADDFFRADAERLGYLVPKCCDEPEGAHDGSWAFGHGYQPAGAGLRAYYRDHGMIQPEVLDKEIPAQEITGLDWNRDVDDLE